MPRSIFDAALPAFVRVSLLGERVCDSADPAADFAALLEFLLRNMREAAVAARLLVTSLLAIFTYPSNQ